MKFLGYKVRVIVAGAVMLLGIFSVSMPSNADNAENIIFPLSGWNPDLLKIIEDGPKIISSDVSFKVAPPPANNSEVTKAELEYLHEIAKTERSEDNIKRILYENGGVKVYELFIEEGLLLPSNAKTINLLFAVDAANRYNVLERKKHFARPRPSQLDTTLDTVITNPEHASYPSGHAAQSYIVALILSEFDPQNANLYKQFAVDIAHRREIAGVHFPSDSIAGRDLAQQVLKELRNVPEFEEKFQAAKADFIKPVI